MMTISNRRSFLGLLSGAGLIGVTGLPLVARAADKIKPGSASALIVVDVQNCFVTNGTLPVPKGEEVVPVINRIAPAFENVVLTQDWHTRGHASFASTHAGKKPFETTKLSYGMQVLWPDHCVQGTDDADRKTPTGLAGYLKQRGIKTVFVSGLATDFCVAWTAMDARKLGFDTYVIEDAARGIDLNGSLAAAWKQMTAKGVKRIQSSDIALPV